MLTETLKNKLKANWGERADCLACNAEVRIFDPLSAWECYLYAMNPHDEDEIACILNGCFVSINRWSVKELQAVYNSSGLPPIIDCDYRPLQAQELYKKLNWRSKYDR